MTLPEPVKSTKPSVYDACATHLLKAAIVDNAMEAIVTANADGTIVEFNRAAEGMFGFAREQAIGRRHHILVPDRYRPRQRALLQQLLHDPTSPMLGRRLRVWALRADGTEFPIETVLWRIDLNGEAHFTAIVRDIAEQRRLADIIERQRNELRQSEKLTTMGSLLAGVAHELNNPLAVVMGRAALLEELAEGSPLQAEAHRVREAATRCARIVRTFLNMAQRRTMVRGEVRLNDVVRGAVDMLGYVLRTHAIKATLRLDDRLPSVCADGDQLGQVVLNLIVNAQQAMSAIEGPRRLSIETGCRPSTPDVDGRIWLRVADTGPGVPADQREMVFAPFFTTKPGGTGTGLGLSVSRGIAREHGGDLALESCTVGATFCMWLPIEPSPPPCAAVPAMLAPPDMPSGLRILVVDDERELADVMRALLESAGFDVAVAHSGALALGLMERAAFDALVSDIRMPDMDGMTLWRIVKSRFPALVERMLFVTGDTLSPDVASFLAESHCPVLHKPFSRSELISKLRVILQGLSQRA